MPFPTSYLCELEERFDKLLKNKPTQTSHLFLFFIVVYFLLFFYSLAYDNDPRARIYNPLGDHDPQVEKHRPRGFICDSCCAGNLYEYNESKLNLFSNSIWNLKINVIFEVYLLHISLQK